jgi:predicted phage-related endonuclease
MSTVEIIVMFEESCKRKEEEVRRAEEMRVVSKIEQLQELEELIDEAKAEAEKIKDEIKMEMMKRNTEEMKAGKYIVRWTEVLSNRFDSTSFKKLFPDVYKEFTKVISSRRFSICG